MLIQFKGKEIDLQFDDKGRMLNIASIIKDHGLRLLGYILACESIPIHSEDTRKILSIIVNHIMGQFNLLSDEHMDESFFISESEPDDNITLVSVEEVEKILNEIRLDENFGSI